ncbi:class I SAM-dependent methyltransferase [Streptomyces sp. SBT349]|uniref:class I SAM-dependent methyltransferase n=1 Tax=Streptomyces sp. SBT349 TaxID=1580539 RepID=UPI00066B52A7|nr:class I SAM-dependent methyltransferase [Streptomyces sp. SBT349]
MSEPDFLRTTRASYDAVAGDYAAHFRTELAGKPFERALLAAFVELVRGAGAGPVADVGCGTGRGTAYLHGLGADVFGVDLSPGMLAEARRAYPGLRFEEGSMTALDLKDGTLGGLAAPYSTIHIPDARLPGVLAEFHRVLAPGGHLLLIFQVGDEPMRRTEAFGQDIALDVHLRRPDAVAALLTEAGFAMVARLEREPDGEESTPPGPA